MSKQEQTPRKKTDKTEKEYNTSFRPKIVTNLTTEYHIVSWNFPERLIPVFKDLGWTKYRKRASESFVVRWCDSIKQVKFDTFKEGEMMANHIPNNSIMTDKHLMVESLNSYSKASGKKIDFIPETYHLDNDEEKQYFFDNFQENEVWLCKPTGKLCGVGIRLVRGTEDVDKIIDKHEERQKTAKTKTPLDRIVQRYIHNPLLLAGKKFDIRAYMLISNCVPYCVLFYNGYCRRSMFDYDSETNNMTVHLTNLAIQTKDPNYKDNQTEILWSMDMMNDYINEHYAKDKEIPKDWTHGPLVDEMKRITTEVFNSVRDRLECKHGYFELYGFDFLVDDNMKVWLIEANMNPSLDAPLDFLKQLMGRMIKETTHVVLECFDKTKRNRPLLPLQSLQHYSVLVCDELNSTQRKRIAQLNKTDRAIRPKSSQGEKTNQNIRNKGETQRIVNTNNKHGGEAQQSHNKKSRDVGDLQRSRDTKYMYAGDAQKSSDSKLKTSSEVQRSIDPKKKKVPTATLR